MHAKIAVMKRELDTSAEKIENKEQENKKLEDDIGGQDKHLSEMNEQLEELTQAYQKEKDEPTRLEKTNTNI
jgi:chromosome segregation ATPase